MAEFLRKYGVATHFYMPIRKRASADFALGADWAPVAGDVKISKDGSSPGTNVTNLPVAIVMGNTAMWDFSMTAAEMTAAQGQVTVSDAATKVVEDRFFDFETHGNASAQYLFDLSLAHLTASQVNAEVVNATTVAIIADSVPADGVRPSMAQALYMILQRLFEVSVSGTTMTVKKVDGSSTLMTLTINDATTPTSITRTT